MSTPNNKRIKLSALGVDGWRNRHVLSMDDFSLTDIQNVIRVSDQMKDLVQSEEYTKLSTYGFGKILGCAFYEASTRTNCSFTAAMQRLGGKVININATSSSVKKGETLSDTMRSLSCYCDVLVLRHPKIGSAKEAAASLHQTPLLNAGDGAGEHPTQALLDIYTIENELKTRAGKTLGADEISITLVGDLKHGRTVHSLVKVLSLFKGITLNLVAPDSLSLPSKLTELCKEKGFPVVTTNQLSSEIVNTSDILYVTRVQKERFESECEYEKVKDCFIVSNKTIQNAKPTLTIMHPLPRVGEILEEVDSDSRAAYFRQMENGMYTRMALIALVLGN